VELYEDTTCCVIQAPEILKIVFAVTRRLQDEVGVLRPGRIEQLEEHDYRDNNDQYFIAVRVGNNSHSLHLLAEIVDPDVEDRKLRIPLISVEDIPFERFRSRG
jgi:hypothetical protein